MAREWADLTKRVAAIEAGAAEMLSQASTLRRELAERSEAAAREAIACAEANERTEAVRTVLTALVQTLGPRAINRREFQDAIRRAAADIPDKGPEAVRHAVILEETRRVLGVKE